MSDIKKAVYKNGIITMPKCKMVIDPRGIGHQYFASMIKNKDKVFQIDGITEEEETYGSFLQRCVRTALKMQSFGVTSNDLITICSLNSLDNFVPYVASFFLGCTLANLDPLLPGTDLTYLIKMINPKMVFVQKDAVELIEKLLESNGKTSMIVVFGQTDKYISFCEFLTPSLGEETFIPTNTDLSKTAIILFSSGTTGMPKGICLSHLAHLKQLSLGLELETSYERLLTFARLYWGTSIFFMGIAIVGGYTKIFLPKFDTDLIWKVIETLNPRYMIISTYQIGALCSRKDVFDKNVNSLNVIYVAGDVVFEQQLLFYRKIFKNAIVKIGYGLSEVGPATHCVTRTEEQLNHLTTKIKTIGSALNGIDYKVVCTDSGKILGPYCNGELLIKSENNFKGYYNLDSSDVWDSGYWFKTGDLVYYDEDFYFYYVARLKEMFKFHGVHVVPKFIENLLSTHPKVKNSRVVGIRDEVDGYHPMAIVQLKESCRSGKIEEELCDFVANNLEDKYKLRGGVKIVDEFPITTTGKIDLNGLMLSSQSNKISKS